MHIQYSRFALGIWKRVWTAAGHWETCRPMKDIELQDDNRDGIIWEDPREGPRDGATLIRRRSGPLDIEVFPPLLIQYAGMVKPDATKACA